MIPVEEDGGRERERRGRMEGEREKKERGGRERQKERITILQLYHTL